MSTLSELNVKIGDVVSYNNGHIHCKILSGPNGCGRYDALNLKTGCYEVAPNEGVFPWFIVSRASDTTVSTPKLWKDMTPEEKGAILLAAHEGKALQYWSNRHEGGWLDCVSVVDDSAYRIKPVPVVETITQYWKTNKKGKFVPMHMNDEPTPASEHNPTHKITFNAVDGEPDVTSIRMECIK